MSIKPIATNKRFRLVIEAIQNYIIEKNLKPGDRLPTEHELAKKLEVGRSSIREAVKSLEVLGVIETKAGEGMFVRSFNYDPIIDNLSYSVLFDRDDLEEILEIRISLELFNLKKVLDNITDEHLNRIKKNLDKMEKAVAEKDKKRFVEADEEFHSLLFEPVGNSLLDKLLSIFWNLLENAKDFSELADPHLEGSYKRHLNIYQALENKDYERLYELTKEHYKFSIENINKTKVQKME